MRLLPSSMEQLIAFITSFPGSAVVVMAVESLLIVARSAPPQRPNITIGTPSFQKGALSFHIAQFKTALE